MSPRSSFLYFVLSALALQGRPAAAEGLEHLTFCQNASKLESIKSLEKHRNTIQEGYTQIKKMMANLKCGEHGRANKKKIMENIRELMKYNDEFAKKAAASVKRQAALGESNCAKQLNLMGPSANRSLENLRLPLAASCGGQ